MSDPFLDPILERIAQAQASSMRIGTVTAIDAPDGSLAVALAGGEVTGVRWVGSYSPTVNDVVVVSQDLYGFPECMRLPIPVRAQIAVRERSIHVSRVPRSKLA